MSGSMSHSVVCAVIVLTVYLAECINCMELIKDVSWPSPSSSSQEESVASRVANFWENVPGEEYVSKLSAPDLDNFTETNSDTFIMFYANWCKSSQVSKDEFASAAQQIAYTEGYNHIHFAAFDCNATMANKRVCNKTYNITRYPRFIRFNNGQMDRMYPVKCPRHAEFFYNWIVHKEDGCFTLISLAMSTSTVASASQVSILLVLILLTASFYRF